MPSFAQKHLKATGNPFAIRNVWSPTHLLWQNKLCIVTEYKLWFVLKGFLLIILSLITNTATVHPHRCYYVFHLIDCIPGTVWDLIKHFALFVHMCSWMISSSSSAAEPQQSSNQLQENRNDVSYQSTVRVHNNFDKIQLLFWPFIILVFLRKLTQWTAFAKQWLFSAHMVYVNVQTLNIVK